MTHRTSNRLSTKLTPPIIRSVLVNRARLVDQLKLGMKRKLSLVVAPAGYGKTTLIGEWLASTTKENWLTAWLTFDSEDNNSLRFWGYISDALTKIEPEWQLDLPISDKQPEDPIGHQLLNDWINQINAKQVHFSLILDDFHKIQLNSIHSDLAYFITHMPQHAHLVIASRTIPKFPLAELRVKNQLIKLSAMDMAFDDSESATFLQELMSLDLTSEEVAKIAHATEGWVAGLQMVALSIKKNTEAKYWINHIRGSNHIRGRLTYIYDYLTEVVISAQEEDIQDFLLKTSILSKFSAPLCNFILDIKDSQMKLNYLEETNLFITPLTEDRVWYRFHALFADTLKNQLEVKYPHSISDLHLRAATWLKENGSPREAIKHAISSGDLELVSIIIDENALQILDRLDFAALRQWLSYLPEDYFWRRPIFWIYLCLTEASLGNFDQVGTILSNIKTSLQDIQGEQLSNEARTNIHRYLAAYQAAVDIHSRNFLQSKSVAMQAISNLPKGDRYTYGWLNHHLGYALEAANELENAIASFVRGCEFAIGSKSTEAYIFSKCEIGRIRKIQGRLREAEREFRQGLDIAHQTGVQGSFLHLIQLALGDLLLEKNQLKETSQLLSPAIAFFTQADIYQFPWLFMIKVYTYLANYYIQTDPIVAKTYLQKARHEVRDRSQLSFVTSIFTDLQVRIWLAEGDFRSAKHWAKERMETYDRSGELTITEQIALARVFLARGKTETAISLVENAENRAQLDGRGWQVLEAMILQAIGLNTLGDLEKSLSILNKALVMAEPEGFIRIFVDEGACLKTLLAKFFSLANLRRKQTNRLPSKQYIETLLMAFDSSPEFSHFSDSHKPQKTAVLIPAIQPLTDRELEILSYLRDKHTAQEIASLLFVSHFTVKTHIRNIYRKLDVHNRKEALERAAQLHLLN